MIPPAVTASEAMARAEAGGPPDDIVLQVVQRRAIREVLHFTTSLGLLGVLGSGLVLSRARLPENRYLEHVFKPNSTRKDVAWLDFVNLSISDINEWMFDRSENWHVSEDLWWACLSFTPAILAEPGVVFTTTNNIYPSVRRSYGAGGLEALFAPRVIGRYQSVHERAQKTDAQPTDRQAEVLFPRQISAEALRAVYVREPEHLDDIEGIFACFPTAEVPLEVRPDVFQ